MGKIIVWIIVIFVILFALRMWNAAKARNRAAPRKAPRRRPADGALRPLRDVPAQGRRHPHARGVPLQRPHMRAAFVGFALT